ncbi:ComF family protein [Actibacterium lipolyticum]|uniref:DNA utilization protein GntX n=1 Tax=Actibacterium lipolyticum TaxID=1524263 RepID=A0A238KW14_9RHOB|nr:double zinc ribbon domain-containing protein [Actibacterium lipolyticum]SMX46979.1 DNA utilization protein GntX [Actibacterium lipolyticum]
MQSALRLIFPPQCISCGVLVESEFALCGSCWRDTHFISGLVCDTCGVPLPGEDEDVQCDDCMTMARPWTRGRAAVLYQDNARRLILSLKHGDRTELARPMATWLSRAVQPILRPDMMVAPVPLHRTRLLRRRYNQAALLAAAVAKDAGLEYCPDLLLRKKRTQIQEGMGVDARFANIAGALQAHPKRREICAGRHVLLVDDVMTSGATLAAGAEACRAAGARDVSVLVLARVAKDM